MNPLKQLAGQTAIYGISSIVGRALNFLLTPLYVYVFTADQYGIVTEMYAYVAFLVIFLTYGMETAYFRFASQKGMEERKVFSTTISSLWFTTGIFILGAVLFADQIGAWLKYPDHAEYIIWFAIIVGLDAISSIPLARLRAQKRAKKFAVINILNVAINISLNVFFLYYCRTAYDAGESSWLVDTFYNPEIGVGYVFISNLIASIAKFLLLAPTMLANWDKPEIALLKPMIKYAYPLLFAGLAYVINETIDRILLKQLLFEDLGEEQTMRQLGIYGAAYKLTMIISMFVQAFRYAAEPFYFNQEKEKGSKDLFAKVMNYFVIIVSVIFLGVMLFLPITKYFIPNPDYWEGLKVVPILLAANICLGVYINQSIWYKLSKQTHFGAIFSFIAAGLTVTLNILLIPEYGYVASAWITLVAYGSMMIASYFVGRKHYPIPYDLVRIFIYVALVAIIYLVSAPFDPYGDFTLLEYGYHSTLLLGFLIVAYVLERPKKVVT